MIQPGRKYSATEGYRYGFNGKEKASEITSDDYDFGARIYDGRIGRWLSVDSKSSKYPMLSPYNNSANNPIINKDIDGKDYILKIFFDEGGVGHIQIIYNSISTSEENKNTLEAGMGLWKALNGTDIKINDIPFKVNFITSNTSEANYDEAKKKFDLAEYTNLYSGNTIPTSGDLVTKKSVTSTYNVTDGGGGKFNISGSTPSFKAAMTSNGSMIQSNITEILHDFSLLTDDQKKLFSKFISEHPTEIDYGKDPITIAHEIGHTMGLNHNSSYDNGKAVGSGADSYTSPFDPKGVMTGAKPPTVDDLKNIIIEALKYHGRSTFTSDEHLKIEISDGVLMKLFPKWDGKSETKDAQANISKSEIKL